MHTIFKNIRQYTAQYANMSFQTQLELSLKPWKKLPVHSAYIFKTNNTLEKKRIRKSI